MKEEPCFLTMFNRVGVSGIEKGKSIRHHPCQGCAGTLPSWTVPLVRSDMFAATGLAIGVTKRGYRQDRAAGRIT